MRRGSGYPNNTVANLRHEIAPRYTDTIDGYKKLKAMCNRMAIAMFE